MEKKVLKEKEVIQYNPNEEQIITNVYVKPVDKIVPLVTINQGNIHCAGYIPEDNRFIIQFKSMRKSIEGFELGIHPEPFDYVYENISPKIWESFLKTSDKIKFFENNIKGEYLFHREEVINSF